MCQLARVPKGTAQFGLSLFVYSNAACGVLIPACGVGNPRVRRWQSPRAAFVNLIGKKA